MRTVSLCAQRHCRAGTGSFRGRETVTLQQAKTSKTIRGLPALRQQMEEEPYKGEQARCPNIFDRTTFIQTNESRVDVPQSNPTLPAQLVLINPPTVRIFASSQLSINLKPVFSVFIRCFDNLLGLKH